MGGVKASPQAHHVLRYVSSQHPVFVEVRLEDVVSFDQNLLSMNLFSVNSIFEDAFKNYL